MLKVCEVFGPTQQGEGKNAGKPCAFLRLAECNLHCSFCDTKFTWSFYGESDDEEIYKREDEVHHMEIEEVFKKLEATGMKHLVISGGEPLIQHKQITPLLEILKENGWTAEIETNGTIFPNNEKFWELIDQVNCSPKLSNAGDPEKLRIKDGALMALARNVKVNFKFVIQTPEDWEEAKAIIVRHKIEEVRLMPECRTPEELQEKEPWLKDLAASVGAIYCTRLSILAGNKRGE